MRLEEPLKLRKHNLQNVVRNLQHETGHFESLRWSLVEGFVSHKWGIHLHLISDNRKGGRILPEFSQQAD